MYGLAIGFLVYVVYHKLYKNCKKLFVIDI